jgi:hypothetical protein
LGDRQHLPPSVEQDREIRGADLEHWSAHAGYWDKDHVGFCEERGIAAHIAPDQLRNNLPVEWVDAPSEKDTEAKVSMRCRLQTPEGWAIHARRKVIVEPVLGWIREGQNFARLLLRRLGKALGEWAPVCAGTIC